jgi:hypothetical protein
VFSAGAGQEGLECSVTGVNDVVRFHAGVTGDAACLTAFGAVPTARR